jgi:hypothetical protein
MHPLDSLDATPALAYEEYRSLRETIQRRGTLRVVIAIVGWVAWAGLAMLGWTTGVSPVAGIIPLLVLAGGFEVVLSLHTGVERIGRYLQVTYESGQLPPPAWEHVAMSMGSRWLSPGGLDPLFSVVFLLAAVINALPGLAAGSTAEIASAAVIHLAFVIRVLLARQFAAKQRAHDLDALHQAISSNSLVSKIQQGR